MIYLCYRAWHRDMDCENRHRCLQQVLRVGGWQQTHEISVDFFLPESRVEFILLQWPCLEHRPNRSQLR